MLASMKTIGLIVALVGFFVAPMFSQIGNSGIRDWDQHLFYFGSVPFSSSRNS